MRCSRGFTPVGLAIAFVVAQASGGCAQEKRPLASPDETELRQAAPDSFRVELETSRGKIVEIGRAHV